MRDTIKREERNNKGSATEQGCSISYSSEYGVIAKAVGNKTSDEVKKQLPAIYDRQVSLQCVMP